MLCGGVCDVWCVVVWCVVVVCDGVWWCVVCSVCGVCV